MAKRTCGPEKLLKQLSIEENMEMSFSRRENTEDIVLKCGNYSGKIPRNILEPSSEYLHDILKNVYPYKRRDGTNHEIDLSKGHDEDMIKAVVVFWTSGSTDPPDGCDRQDFVARFLAEATKLKMHGLCAVLRLDKAGEDKLVAGCDKQNTNKEAKELEGTKESRREAKKAAKKAAKKEGKEEGKLSEIKEEAAAE